MSNNTTANLKEEVLKQIAEDEKKMGRKIVLRRYLAELNPRIVKGQALTNQNLREDNPLDAKTLAAVSLAAAFASRVPMCIRNNMKAASAAGFTNEEIGAIMAQTQFITGTAVLSASLDGLKELLGDIE